MAAAGREVLNLLEASAPVEAAIAELKAERSQKTLTKAWDALFDFWEACGDAPETAGRRLDVDGIHFRLALRFVQALDHAGFSPDSEEGMEVMTAAAGEIAYALNDGMDESEVLAAGEDLEIDLIAGLLRLKKTEVGPVGPVGKEGPVSQPSLIRGEPYVRDVPKVGRNDPCSCGSGKKHKRCCLALA